MMVISSGVNRDRTRKKYTCWDRRQVLGSCNIIVLCFQTGRATVMGLCLAALDRTLWLATRRLSDERLLLNLPLSATLCH